VQSFNYEYGEARKVEIENLSIQNAFTLQFSSETTANFLDLVSKDISEEMDDEAEVYYSV
jgi:hypothetical protein